MNNGNGFFFSSESLADALQLWNRAAISLVDIRHNLISPHDALLKYRMPASMFVYTTGAKAEVLLDDTSYYMERFGLFHGGKGTELSISPIGDWLEYYMVLYKAGEPAFHKREYNRLLERVNPFKQRYGFAPDNPLFFAEQLRKMFERWQGPTPLNHFYGKTAFYQLVYEVYEELDKGKVDIFSPILWRWSSVISLKTTLRRYPFVPCLIRSELAIAKLTACLRVKRDAALKTI